MDAPRGSLQVCNVGARTALQSRCGAQSRKRRLELKELKEELWPQVKPIGEQFWGWGASVWPLCEVLRHR